MSTPHLLILGAIAGLTIFLGLPIGRIRSASKSLKAFLNAVATGILVFLLWDVLSGGWGPVEGALANAQNHAGSWLRFYGLSATFFGFFALGLLSLVYYDKAAFKRSNSRELASSSGGVAVLEKTRTLTARQLATFIAVGIGVHNFAEGLAIGQSAGNGEVTLATMLIIGFGLHNATEGFGIVAPLASEAELPSWRFLGAMGLIGGGPTFFGTVIGRAFVNEALLIAFLAMAGGSILYVVSQLLHVGRKLGSPEITMWGVFLGVSAGFATDLILKAAGV